MPIEQTALDEFASDLAPAPPMTGTVARIQPDVTDSLASEFLEAAPSSPQTTGARMAVTTALTSNADKYARANQLAKQYHVPGDFAERNLDWLENKAKIDGINELPVATRTALSDPHIAKLSHDDMQHIAELETRLGGFDSAEPIVPPKPTVGSVIAGLVQNVESQGELARQGLRMQMGDLFGFNTVTEDAARKTALARTDLAIANPQFESDLASGAYSGATSLLQQIPAMAAGAATGGVGIPLAMAGLITETEAYTRYRDREASPLTAFGGAITEGAIEVATESIPMGYFVSKFGKDGLAKFLGKFVAKDFAGEQVATFLQDATDAAVQNPDKTWGEYWRERPSAAVQTLGAVLTMSGAVAPLQLAAHRHEKKVQAANVAIAHARALDQIRAISANSVLRERSPDDFAKVLDQMVGSERDFYVDGNVLLQAIESGGEQAAGVIAQAPTVAEQLDEALPTNGLVRIPAKEFLTAFSGSGLDEALVPHLRVTEDAPSAAEAEEFLQQQAEVIKAEATKAMEQMATDQAFIDSAHAVEAKILADLTTANRWTDDVNKTYAQLARDFVVTQAAREGISPEDFFARYSLRTVATPVEGFDHTRGVTAENALRELAAAYGDEIVIQAVAGGDFAGVGKLNIDENGNVILTRHASNEEAITKSGMSMTPDELRQYANGGGTFGGASVNTSALTHWGDNSWAGGHGVVGTFTIPIQDLKGLLARGEAVFANVAEGEISLLPSVAERYLTHLNGQVVATPPSGGFDQYGGSTAVQVGIAKNKSVAEEMLAAGADPEQVRVATGWFNGQYDNKPRFEFSDAEAAFTEAFNNLPESQLFGDKQTLKLGDVLQHDELFKYYPDAANIEIVKRKGFMDMGGLQGWFNPESNEIGVTPYAKDPLSTVLHEVQHWIQMREGFATGGNENAVFEALTPEQKTRIAEKAMTAAQEAVVEASDKLAATAAILDSPLLRPTIEAKILFHTLAKTGNPGDPDRMAAYEAMSDAETALRKDVFGSEDYFDLTQAQQRAMAQVATSPFSGDTIEEHIAGAKQKAEDGFVKAQQDAAAIKSGDAEAVKSALKKSGDLFKLYKAIAGEIEARDTQARQQMTPAERAATPPMSSETFDPKDVVVAFNKVEQTSLAQNTPNGWGSTGPGGEMNLAPGAGTKGTFNPKTLTISLLQNADLSTWLHELGHFQLAVLADMASRPNAPPGVVEDMNTLLDWFKVKDLETWNAMSLEEQRASHEKFARSFEAYLFEGKAPTLDLEPVFARIKTFMMRVYKSVKDILSRAGASPTPEVSAVFDRLLAAEADIKAAEEARSMLPLFKTREEFPGDDTQWQTYQDDVFGAHEAGAAQLQARSLRDMQWMANLRVRMLKAKQKEAAAIRKGVLEEVVNELSATPVYAVQDFLRGKERAPLSMDWLTTDQRTALMEIEASNTKLDLDMLKAMYGEAPDAPWRELPTGKNGLAGLEGMDPEIVAKLFNFQSADEMIKAILAAPPRETAAEGEVDRRMLIEHGDLNDARAIEEAVNDAIHNKVRTRVIATTLGALDKAVKNTRDMTKALRGMVKESLAGRRVGDIKPGRHVAAESRAAKEAQAALKKGDNKGAANAVRQQLWHNLSATEARNVEKELERKLKYLRKFRGRVESIATDYQDRIDDLLERFDLRQRSEAQIQRSESLSAWLDKVEDESGVRPVVDPALESEAKRQNYQRMTLEEFRGLVDSVRSIEHMGRLKQKLMTARRERELDSTAVALQNAAEANAPRTISTERTKYLAVEAILTGGDKFLASHRKMASFMEELDGLKPGLWSEVFLEPLNNAAANEAERMAATSKTLIDLFKHVMKGGFVARHTRTVVPGAVDRNGRALSLSHEERLAAALNSGNEKNLQRLRDGDGWTDQTIAAIHASLTKEDWDFVQSVWDHVSSYKAEIGQLEKDLTGVEPEWQDATPITTPHGVYKGGYYPIMYDTERSLTAVEFDTIADLSIMMRGARGKQTTRNGFTKRRAETVTGRPLSLKFNVLFKHVNDVNHRLAWERTLYDTRQLLNRSEVKASLEKHLGTNAARAINELMTEVAVGDLKVRDWFDEMADRLASNASLAIMGLNLMTAATQPLGLTQTVVEIGYKATHDGIMTFYKDPKAQIERVNAKSSVMRTRALAWNQNITYLRNQLKGTGATIRNWAFIPMTFMQGAVDYPTWIGAYQSSLGEGKSDADAVARADQAVLNSQGGGQTKDLSAAQRGKGAKALFTRFYNYANTTFQLIDRTVRRDKNSLKDYAQATHDLMLLTIVPTVLLTLLRAALMGGGDDDKSLAEKMARETLASILGLVVGGRELASIALGYDYQGPAGARLVPTLGKVVKQASQGEVDKPFLEALNMAAGLTFGYPATQVQRTVEGAYDIASGETANPAVLLFGPRRE